MRYRLLIAAVAVAQLGLATGLNAQTAYPDLKIEPLTPTVAVLVGPGGNVTVGHGAGGVALVDAEVRELGPEVVAATHALDARPPAFVIDTHWHFDHVGGNAAVAKAGAVIVAQDNVRVRMASGGTIAFARMTLPPAT